MNIENFHPLNGRILIEVLPDNSVYEGAIIRLDEGQEKSNLAIVKAVHTGYNDKSPSVKVGDTVMFNKYSGSILKIDRFEDKAPEYRVIKEDDILGILR